MSNIIFNKLVFLTSPYEEFNNPQVQITSILFGIKYCVYSEVYYKQRFNINNTSLKAEEITKMSKNLSQIYSNLNF